MGAQCGTYALVVGHVAPGRRRMAPIRLSDPRTATTILLFDTSLRLLQLNVTPRRGWSAARHSGRPRAPLRTGRVLGKLSLSLQ